MERIWSQYIYIFIFFSISTVCITKISTFHDLSIKIKIKNSSNNNNSNYGIVLFHARFWSCVIFFSLFIFSRDSAAGTFLIGLVKFQKGIDSIKLFYTSVISDRSIVTMYHYFLRHFAPSVLAIPGIHLTFTLAKCFDRSLQQCCNAIIHESIPFDRWTVKNPLIPFAFISCFTIIIRLWPMEMSLELLKRVIWIVHVDFQSPWLSHNEQPKGLLYK